MATFNTERFKKLVAYAIKGAGFISALELTQKIGIRVRNGKLYLNTTDGTNHLCISEVCSAGIIDVTVDAELFSKLISKITSDTIDLEVTDKALIVEGNGKYILPLFVDENGAKYSFPDVFPDQTTDIGTISPEDAVILNTAIKASVSDNAESVFSSFYIGDMVAGTDKSMVSVLNHKVFDVPHLINRDFVDLMCIEASSVTISEGNGKIVATIKADEDCDIKVCTNSNTEVSAFPVDGVHKFVSLEVDAFCRIPKAQMLDLLNRMSLFVNKYDANAVQLHFTDSNLEVSSLASDGIEFIDYVESKNTKDLTIKINIDRLRNQLKSYSSDMVDLYYGSEICIKLVDGDMTQVIALMK